MTNDSKVPVVAGEIQAAGSHALVVTADDERSAMVLMDRNDLDQALAELRGDVIEQFVYVVPERRTRKGQVIPAKQVLTYAGIKEAARLYKNVHFGAGAQLLADGTWMLTSYAHNLADNTRIEYPMPYPAFNALDTYESTDFRANLSKSIRNALAAVLPVAYLNTMIKKWLEQKEVGPAGAVDVTELQREIAVLLGYDQEARDSFGGQDWKARPLPKLLEIRRRLIDRAEKRLTIEAPPAERSTPEELGATVDVQNGDQVVIHDVTPQPAAIAAPATEDDDTTKRRLAVEIQDLCAKTGRDVPASTRDWVTLGTDVGLPAITKSSQMSVEWFEQIKARLQPIGKSMAYAKWENVIAKATARHEVIAALEDAALELDADESAQLDKLGEARFESLPEEEAVPA